jgi:hypothetical protein
VEDAVSLPKDYVLIPMPSFQGSYSEVGKKRWDGIVHARARILDPDFHGGKTEAIRVITGWAEEEIPPPAWAQPGRKFIRRTPVLSDWIEFRNFKDANAYVQAVRRLSK